MLVAGYFQDEPSKRGIYANACIDGYSTHFGYGSTAKLRLSLDTSKSNG